MGTARPMAKTAATLCRRADRNTSGYDTHPQPRGICRAAAYPVRLGQGDRVGLPVLLGVDAVCSRDLLPPKKVAGLDLDYHQEKG